jgi:hypothetical protein
MPFAGAGVYVFGKPIGDPIGSQSEGNQHFIGPI